MKAIRSSISRKNMLGIAIGLILFSVMTCAIGYKSFTDALLAQYEEEAFHTAHSAALWVDGDLIGDYMASGGETEQYQTILRRLDRLCNLTGATFVYVIVPDLTDYAHITFVFSTVNREYDYTLYDFGYVRETTNDEYKGKYRALYEGKSDRELVIRDKGYIETDPHITCMIPLKTDDGETKAILCVQRQMDALTDLRMGYVLRVSILTLIVGALALLVQGLFHERLLIQPIRTITREAGRYAAEGAKTGTRLTDIIRNTDEIGILASSIDKMEEEIESYVGDLTRITAEKERISTELSLAARIQKDVLPDTFPAFPDRQDFDIYASMTPARTVGGDFYNYFLIDDDHLCLYIADVSGKGIPAALFMMASMIILGNYAAMGSSPAEVLEKTNDIICLTNKEEMFVTVWIGILELSTGRLTAANAGHEYPVLKQGGAAFKVFKDHHGFVVGGMESMRYREYEMTLEPGSTLFLYTDGVAEAMNAGKEMFGLNRLVLSLNRDRESSPEELLRRVRQDVDDFVQEEEQFDDLTMLCLHYRGPEGSDPGQKAGGIQV